jgi:sulfur-carrier protein adenylyltransferase/sulfurtransferase
MPDGKPRLDRVRDRAVAAVRQFLESGANATVLTAAELRSDYPRRHDFVAGFRVAVEIEAEQRRFDVLLPADFPFSAPRVALVDRPQFLTWPHIEQEGLICLLPSMATVDPADAIGQVKFQLAESIELVEACLRGELLLDFQAEFSSYWVWNCTPGAAQFISLVAPAPPSRKVSVWRGNAFYVMADDDETVQRWLDNRFGREKKAWTVDKGWLFWLPEPLVPHEYPKTAPDVARIASRVDDANGFLESAARDLPASIIVVFGAMSSNGPCFAGIKIEAPVRAGIPGKGKKRTAANGFRKDRLPIGIAVDRYWHASTPIVRSDVVRADASWIHGRGKDRRQPQLATQHVVMIGCGSVGAPVAEMLSMAGVGRMTLIDPETLTFANTGRHALGANHVADHKAQGLALNLRGRFPHHQFDFQNANWQTVNRTRPELLRSASVVVSVVGDWNSESELNLWHLDNGQQPPVVYGWTEAHACAGHALAIMPGTSTCFVCGFSSRGVPRFSVTRWSGSTVEQEPGCGATFQPYGPTELAHTTTLIAEITLDVLLGSLNASEHRVWACRHEFLRDAGGTWTDAWMQLTNGRSEGGFVFDRRWDNPGCHVCGAQP